MKRHPRPLRAVRKSVLVLDWRGCCPGCNTCFGGGYHCHQAPCRCELPCSCDHWSEEWWDRQCERHKFEPLVEDFYDDDIDDVRPRAECSTCGQTSPCAYDDNGEPLFHMEPEEDFTTWAL